MTTFLAFPAGGLLARFVAGPLDDPVAALVGGLLAGTVIGGAQALAAADDGLGRRWAVATAVGLGIGTMLGAAAVGFATGLADLVAVGAIAGAVVGLGQTLALSGRIPLADRRWWAPAAAATWALGWGVTTAAGVDVGQQFHVFGATGALAYTTLTGLALRRLPWAQQSTSETAATGVGGSPASVGSAPVGQRRTGARWGGRGSSTSSG
jgi:hypothetical protein